MSMGIVGKVFKVRGQRWPDQLNCTGGGIHFHGLASLETGVLNIANLLYENVTTHPLGASQLYIVIERSLALLRTLNFVSSAIQFVQKRKCKI